MMLKSFSVLIQMLKLVHELFFRIVGVNCGDPGGLTNGGAVTSGILYGDNVTYTCQTGYNITGDVNRTCQSNAVWSGSRPKCWCMMLFIFFFFGKKKILHRIQTNKLQYLENTNTYHQNIFLPFQTQSAVLVLLV